MRDRNETSNRLQGIAHKYHNLMGRIEAGLWQVGVVLLTLLVFVVLTNVVMRYIFENSLLWANEVSRYLMVWFALLLTASLVYRDDHLNVGLFYDKFSRETKYWLQVGIAIIYIAIGLIWAYFGLEFAVTAGFRATAPALDIQLVWVYSVIPISGVLTILFSVDRLLRLTVLDMTLTELEFEFADERGGNA